MKLAVFNELVAEQYLFRVIVAPEFHLRVLNLEQLVQFSDVLVRSIKGVATCTSTCGIATFIAIVRHFGGLCDGHSRHLCIAFEMEHVFYYLYYGYCCEKQTYWRILQAMVEDQHMRQ